MDLFIYEHCPYCIRVCLAAGYKNIALNVQVLAYDDQYPISLAGKKVLPVLQKKDGQYMGESLDICHYLDQFDSNTSIAANSQPIITDLAEQIRALSRPLVYPRQTFHPMNAEVFLPQSAADYYRQKMETSLAVSFEQAFLSSEEYVDKLQQPLHYLNQQLIRQYSSSEQFSYDDIILFPVLRGLTVAQDVLKLPANIEDYLNRLSARCNVTLYSAYQFNDSF